MSRRPTCVLPCGPKGCMCVGARAGFFFLLSAPLSGRIIIITVWWADDKKTERDRGGGERNNAFWHTRIHHHWKKKRALRRKKTLVVYVYTHLHIHLWSFRTVKCSGVVAGAIDRFLTSSGYRIIIYNSSPGPPFTATRSQWLDVRRTRPRDYRRKTWSVNNYHYHYSVVIIIRKRVCIIYIIILLYSKNIGLGRDDDGAVAAAAGFLCIYVARIIIIIYTRHRKSPENAVNP